MALKLSEAIRLGAMLRPQGFLFTELDGRTCAVGAAIDAGGQAAWDLWLKFEHDNRAKGCPVCDANLILDCLNVLPHLNDDHRWTREAIADFVASKEHQAEPALSPVLAHPAVREGK